MFDKVLVANRGEIAVRVIRTLRALGIRSVAVYSDADADARHVREADEAVRIGPPPAVESYLSVESLLAAAASSGAQAVHPGYGFLAENAGFARACEEAGLTFIGPSADAIALMGDKIRAKETVEAAGVPVVPGGRDPELAEAARDLGAPVLLKPSAGGGGKGMRLVRDLTLLEEEIAAARREARASFGDDTLLVERWIDRPRHIEIQVLADGHGNVVHLGERECSLQRRHQKIIEEAPSVLLDEATRAAMGAAAVEAARSCGYRGAGTVEFIVPGKDPSSYYFMEMNTRLQVEHPVTELITGLDLVEWQVRVAAGERLPFGQDDITLTGHAVEARLCAETVSVKEGARGFLPSGGTVLALSEPEGDGVRTDSGLTEGTVVSSLYDPMLAKVIAYGPDRATALRRLRAALARTVTLGVPTNAGFLRRLLAHPDVVAGDLDTGLVERAADGLVDTEVPAEVYAAAGALRQRALAPAPDDGWTDPFARPDGWRLGGEPAWTTHHVKVSGHDPVEVRVRAGEVLVDGVPTEPARLTAVAGDWLGRDGDAWHVQDHDPVAASLTGAGSGGAGSLTAPMPGTVTVVKVAVGDEVTAGQSLLVVEAMKMEHVIASPHAGTVTELDVTPGTTVAMDQILAVVEPSGASEQIAPEGARDSADQRLRRGARATTTAEHPADGRTTDGEGNPKEAAR
ncbi:acetyl/propionyl-CoA carboxylase subunit alpha [Streptomyces sp. SID8379]|uniref:ATP-binding protein n=1 Tax=unclassified Streptomyces TaxID=2593676 RepID=UPI0003769FCB|nr:biotin carboxylase N-terminal domain-containing protein [Streptomyces sp. HmicA12]MYW65958.1 acetyl/propionyl-CoA carboxylase subunit alpha [Streptomyces sp. SID8379]